MITKLTSLLADYRLAIRAAAGGRAAGIPAGLWSVAIARSRFDVGPKYHSLYGLRKVPGSEWGEYIIDNQIKPMMRKINVEDARIVVNDKFRFQQHCAGHGLQTIPILAKIDRREPEHPLNANDSQALATLLANAPRQVFIKLIDGSWGLDAFTVERVAADQWEYCEQRGSTSALFDFCIKRLKHRRGWIMQPVMQSSDIMREIMSPHALGTIRALSFLEPDGASVPYAVIRLPVGANTADNFSHGASGNLVAPIDVDTGTIGTARGPRSTGWPDIVAVETHPDTGKRISGFVIPNWHDVIELISRAQRSLPRLPTLGWDIAITNAGPLIVEANCTYDFDLLQVAYQRGLRTEIVDRRLHRLLPNH